MEYKVTLEKCEEYLKEPLYGVLKPWKSPLVKQKLNIAIPPVIVIAPVLFLNKLYWPLIIFLAIVGFWLVPYAKDRTKEQYRKELVQKIKNLVQDPELTWLNFVRGKKTMKSTEKIDWKRDFRSRLTELTFRVLAYLKKEEGSQGIHRFIPEWQDSNSANHHLKRMVTKGLIESSGNDYQYRPWTFSIVQDETGINMPSAETEKVAKLLEQAWEEMIDGYYPSKP